LTVHWSGDAGCERGHGEPVPIAKMRRLFREQLLQVAAEGLFVRFDGMLGDAGLMGARRPATWP